MTSSCMIRVSETLTPDPHHQDLQQAHCNVIWAEEICLDGDEERDGISHKEKHTKQKEATRKSINSQIPAASKASSKKSA